MKPHKHAELIKAWADGAEIEVYQPAFDRWEEAEPAWHTSFEYRIKPEPKPDFVFYFSPKANHALFNLQYGTSRLEIKGYTYEEEGISNLKLTFDGETGELKSAEVLK